MPTLYEITIPVFIKQLTTLSKLLEEGVAHAKDSSNAVTEESLVDARLIADMQTLAYQSMSLPLGPSLHFPIALLPPSISVPQTGLVQAERESEAGEDEWPGLMSTVQRVSDTSKGVAVRVGKLEPVAFEDNEKTFPELQERIAKTIKFLQGVDVSSLSRGRGGERR
jgi:hypothetical protein